jgi:hypothetical protein
MYLDEFKFYSGFLLFFWQLWIKMLRKLLEMATFDLFFLYSYILFFVFTASKPIHYELPLVGFEILASFRALGISIPTSVRKVLKVQKVCVLGKEEQLTYDKDKAVQDLGHIHHSVVLVSDNTIIGIFVFDEISSLECAQIEKISRGIYAMGGEVKRGPSKGSDKMVMCGWRRHMGKKSEDIDAFGR